MSLGAPRAVRGRGGRPATPVTQIAALLLACLCVAGTVEAPDSPSSTNICGVLPRPVPRPHAIGGWAAPARMSPVAATAAPPAATWCVQEPHTTVLRP